MNRVKSDQRTTNGVTKTISYGHNADGTLASVTYPSGRVLSYQVGGAQMACQWSGNNTQAVKKKG